MNAQLQNITYTGQKIDDFQCFKKLPNYFDQQFIDIEQLESGIYNLTIKEVIISIDQLQFIKIN